ncbi:FG-GAP repeat domain-containing protein [Actinoplanes sp. RD1]|uniref:FG-GAP repeat domain-containing protein n=1 Tax=Actinoplanes sp. RD1 TaxID=3064538 RepID=UPI002741F2A3|nr:VCBS repeat-containing protein [Actinoplanes sp. RD1]
MLLASNTQAYAADPAPQRATIGSAALAGDDEGESDFADLGAPTGEASMLEGGFEVAAAKVPDSPNFGPAIEGYAAADYQTTCDPDEKPGPVSLRALLNSTYGLNRTGNISRACGSGGKSEHKEGRALDYMLDVNDSAQKKIANSVVDWMLDTDSYGHKHAVARRMGIMYIIWNRKIWSASRASEGWRSYSGSSPHTDHIHFSFGWPGARKQTSWWTAALPEGPGSVDGDGRADLIVHNTAGEISIRNNKGSFFENSGTRSTGWDSYLGYPGQGRLYYADINGDRKTDLLNQRTNGEIFVRYNRGSYWDDGVLFTKGWQDYLGGEGQGKLFFADMNGDGRADLIVLQYDGSIVVRYNRGSFFEAQPAVSQGWADYLYEVNGKLYFTDVNGDRKADMLVHRYNGDINIRYGTGSSFGTSYLISEGWASYLGDGSNGRLYFADINGDDKSDMIVHRYNGDISVRYSQSTSWDGGTLFSQGWQDYLGNGGGRLSFA